MEVRRDKKCEPGIGVGVGIGVVGGRIVEHFG